MSSDASFADFLHQVRAGDDRAAAEFVKTYEPFIRRVIRFRMTDPRLNRTSDSADICQSVLASFFMRAAAGQYNLDEPVQLVGLLKRMARNKLAQQVRKQNAHRRDARRVAGAAVEDIAVADGGPSPSRLAAGKELLLEVQKRLSDEERQVAEMRGQGDGWADIAVKLGGTADGRRMQLTRALDRISQDLGLEESE